MVNTTMVLIVCLVTAVVTSTLTQAAAGGDMKARGRRQCLDESTGLAINTTDCLGVSEDERVSDDLNSTAERKGCSPTISCERAGGFCVKRGADCDGTLDRAGCKGGKKCKCCIPDPTTSTPLTCPVVTCPPSQTTDPTTSAPLTCPVVTCPPSQTTDPTTSAPLTCPVVTCPPCQTTDTTTPAHLTSRPIPAGWEVFNGRVVLVTKKEHSRGTFQYSVNRCTSLGAKPFIPYTQEEFDFLVEINQNLTSSSGQGDLWIPASDINTEGDLRWTDNTDASSSTSLDWCNGQSLSRNSASSDCCWIYRNCPNTVQMGNCHYTPFPMVCEI